MAADKMKNPEIEMLIEAVLQIQTAQECSNFFEDLCTMGEIQAMAQRIHVAKMLDAGKTYSEIADETGASSATISRVRRSLDYGADGYQTIIDRMNQ